MADDRHPDGAGRPPGDDGPAGAHHHAHPTNAGPRPIAVALALLSAFLVGEVVAAVLSGSLALLADAGHMLTDVGALAMTLWAARLAARPAGGIWTFGLKRAEVLSAAVNGVTLAAMGLLITVEAIRRLVQPPAVDGGVVLVVALVGAAVNVSVTLALTRADRTSINVRGAVAHVLTDLYAFLGTAIAGAVILVTGATRADAAASLLVAALMGRAAWRLLSETGRILLEAAPEDIDLPAVRAHLHQVAHVRDVHDLHVWTVTSGMPTLSAHVVVEDECFATGHAPEVLDALQACLAGHFDVEHATFQLEPASHADHEHGVHG